MLDTKGRTVNGGKNYILAVNEFRAFLTYRYGPTDQITEFSQIKSAKGVVIFGDSHIELFDGDTCNRPRAWRRMAAIPARRCRAAFSPAAGPGGSGRRPETERRAVKAPRLPRCRIGSSAGERCTMSVTIIIYFFSDGSVVYIEQKPNAKWIPPKTIGNRGVIARNDAMHGFKVTWGLLKGETSPTIEDFTPLGWASHTEMNAASDKYSPIYARKMV